MAFRRPDSPDELTVAETARALGVSDQTARRMIDAGEIAGAHRTAGGQRRVPRAAVEAYSRGEQWESAA